MTPRELFARLTAAMGALLKAHGYEELKRALCCIANEQGVNKAAQEILSLRTKLAAVEAERDELRRDRGTP